MFGAFFIDNNKLINCRYFKWIFWISFNHYIMILLIYSMSWRRCTAYI